MLVCSLPATAQEKGNWRAASSTAQSITGDITLSEEKLSINFSGFPIARIRSLQSAELSAVFEPGSGPENGPDSGKDSGTGSLYRLSIPVAKKFLHRNTMCGAEETQWMATFVAGHTLQLAFFSGPKPPVFTPAAIANTTSLCGTYTYAR